MANPSKKAAALLGSRASPRAWTRLAACLLLGGCGAQDKVLQPDEESPRDGGLHDAGGSGGGGDSGGANASSGGNTQGGNSGLEGDAGSVGTAEDAECDLNGLWAVRQLTQSDVPGLGAVVGPQIANNWYYFELRQEGRDVVVVDHFDCGIKVWNDSSLGVVVTVSSATRRALIAHNSQVGRKGVMHKDGSTCSLAIERFWSVRGADEERFAPEPRNTRDSAAVVEDDKPLPEADHLAGAEDWEMDGEMGLAWQVSGLARGTRNTIQRDWTEWFTDATHTIVPEKNWSRDLEVRATFDSQENVISAKDQNGKDNKTLSQLATPSKTAEHRLTLRFLGRTKADPRAVDFVNGTKEARCDAIESALPAQKSL